MNTATRLGTLALAAAMALPLALYAKPGSEDRVGPTESPAVEQPVIDVAVCLDVSGSMSGLIESAKRKLWTIVNELAKAKPTPVLRVALLSYGTPRHPAESGWVKKDLDLTTDLDKVYEVLHGYTTNGGTEYVARVVREAALTLDWTPSHNALKLVFVAGNEAATQDPQYTVPDVFKQAISKGIQVNTIYCGTDGDGISAGWKEAATYADGRYAFIDQDRGAPAIATPVDDKLNELNRELNKTYRGYGAQGASGTMRQAQQDANAQQMSRAVSAERAAAKAQSFYSNAHWDLVDASEKKEFKLEEIPEEQLPEEMRDMTLEEKKARITELKEQREKIQKEILELSKQRDAYVQEELEKRKKEGGPGFDEAVKEAIRKQAQEKGYAFE